MQEVYLELNVSELNKAEIKGYEGVKEKLWGRMKEK